MLWEYTLVMFSKLCRVSSSEYVLYAHTKNRSEALQQQCCDYPPAAYDITLSLSLSLPAHEAAGQLTWGCLI